MEVDLTRWRSLASAPSSDEESPVFANAGKCGAEAGLIVQLAFFVVFLAAEPFFCYIR